jgi:hypothetical protein
MRKTFDPQLQFGATPIEKVKIPLNSRHEVPAVVRAMQAIYCNNEINQKIFAVLSEKIIGNKKQTGRPGMDLWYVLVLGVLRLATNANYDELAHYANYDRLIRQIMGIDNVFDEHQIVFSYNTLRDNISLFDEDMLKQINDIIVEYGHKVVKKKENEKLQIKADSYVLESTVHFPTDMNLLYDATRKCIELIAKPSEKYNLKGWRKSADWIQRVKNRMRSLSKTAFNGGKNKDERVLGEATKYIEIVETLSDKVMETILELYNFNYESEELNYFYDMQLKHIDLIRRRMINKEVIPNDEKMFSLFETYTEWLNKGKQGGKIELGVKLLVATDQYDFIVDYQLMNNQVDLDQTIPVADRLLAKFGYDSISSISYDKGFSKHGNKELIETYIPKVILDKRGKLNKAEKESQQNKDYKKLKFAHSAVESNINCLEHHGLDKCPDKSEKGFRRYAGFGILAYNLHKIGNVLIAADIKKLIKKAG